jgi:hypothetical protein
MFKRADNGCPTYPSSMWGKKKTKKKTIFSTVEEGPVVVITLRLRNLCPKGILP